MVTTEERRQFLRMVGMGGVAGAALGAGLVSLPAFAAEADGTYPKDAFEVKGTPDQAAEKLFGKGGATESDKVKLTAPDIAENGAVVPMSVDADLPNVTRIAFFAPKNPFALASAYSLGDGVAGSVGNRLKLQATMEVVAYVEAGGKVYKSKSKHVKVTAGGCGG